jgi:UDP-N-acetylglucosamine--N-acetylmuramyl-(pentapeptide) pyrophosphoryl-undecaprenol N-acetylglucosamine transferase
MEQSSKLACLIAAGGTAGHVRPALAVAEALRARGVTVTFAGSPGRVESRLVPDAGFELDTFPISGLPRKLGLDLVRALIRAARAPFACNAILARRRPDVVLGAGGYVAGPMVLAARIRRVPTALTEADAISGSQSARGPFARRVFLSYSIPGRDGAKYVVTGRPIPAAHLGAERTAVGPFGLPADGPVLAVFGGLPEPGSERVRRRRVRRVGLRCCTCRVRGLRGAAGRGGASGLRLASDDGYFGEALAVATSRSRAGGTVWGLAAAGTPSILVPYPYATADHRAPTHGTSSLAAARCLDQSNSAGACARGGVAQGRRRLRGMREAMLALARPHAAEAIADELVRLARGRA